MKHWAKKILGGVAVVAVVIQFIKPTGKNPPVTPGHDLLSGANPPPANVAKLLRAACYDCHSHETVWPWYGHVAPVSWWIADHREEGRHHLNFSEWPHDDAPRARKKFSHISEAVDDGSMPLPSYTWVHAAARLTPAQRKVLIDWADAESARLKDAP